VSGDVLADVTGLDRLPSVLAPSVLAVREPGGTLALVKLADEGSDPAFPSRTFRATDLFEPNCAMLLPATGTSGQDEHPFNAYDIAYPYCRTALHIAVDDPDPNPLLAQVTSFARYLSARVVATVCAAEVPLRTFKTLQILSPGVSEPAPCAVFSIVHPQTGEGFLAVDGSKITLPLQVLLQLVAVTGQTRTGWINVLPPGYVSP
jgi:hypothetical protein